MGSLRELSAESYVGLGLLQPVEVERGVIVEVVIDVVVIDVVIIVVELVVTASTSESLSLSP